MTVSAQWISESATDPETFVACEPDLLFPKYAYLDVDDEPDLLVDLRLAVFFDRSTRRYAIDSIELRRRPRWDSNIDGNAMRALRLQEYIQRGLGSIAQVEGPEGARMPSALGEDEAAAIRAEGPSNVDTLRWVARLYSVAWALHLPPALYVQEQLRLTRPTTSVWLRRARDRGLLTDPMDRDQDWLTEADYQIVREALS